jgi:hypothetical protein
MLRANPSPEGRGWLAPASRVRGKENIVFCTPHPPLRGTLSLRERDSLEAPFTDRAFV